MHIFELASHHRAWLSQRQATLAGNIANANTPGYAARYVQDFASLLTQSRAGQAVTHPAHISTVSDMPAASVETAVPDYATHSGNTVDVEHELLNASEIRSGYALNVSVVKTFNRMLQAGLRS